MKRYFLLMSLFVFLILSCEREDETKVLDFEKFQMEVPDGWNRFSKQGYDSYVGGITNGKYELTYDYGWYSYNFNDETSETHSHTNTTIDGRPALIVKPKKRGKGIIGVYIEVDDAIKFSLYGRNIKDEKTVLKIFNSLTFEE